MAPGNHPLLLVWRGRRGCAVDGVIDAGVLHLLPCLLTPADDDRGIGIGEDAARSIGMPGWHITPVATFSLIAFAQARARS